MGASHTFHAVAFVQNLALKELARAFPEARRTAHELWYATPSGGIVFVYPFGAMVLHDVPEAERASHVARLRAARPGLTDAKAVEEVTVREDAVAHPDIRDGVLLVARLGFEGKSVVAMTLAQSAAMEYYERIVDQMFLRTDHLVDRVEQKGRAPFTTRPLHRFIGAAIGTRNEVLSILHLLDKPDAVWDDADADRIYQELRAEFDLADRYLALEHKLRSVQEALELVLDMSRDFRLVLLEFSIVLLIVAEIALSLFRHT
ncbi:MAG: RMD1 family protein [Burkholderiales bacterium]|nr:RMD1 family protein [Burkholderiales bacterium]